MKTAAKLLLAIALLGSALFAKEPGSEEIIDKMIKAYGGVENLKQLENYKQSWHIETKMSDKNGTDNREVRVPNYLSTELTYPDKTEVRILDNGIGIKKTNGREMNAKGPMLDAMRLQLMRLYHPLEFKNRVKEIKVSTTATQYMLSIDLDTITAEYFVSKKSYFIEKVIGRLSMGGQSMEFLTLYEDYRSVKGVMMPHTEVKYAGTFNTAIMRLQSTEFLNKNRNSKFVQLNVSH